MWNKWTSANKNHPSLFGNNVDPERLQTKKSFGNDTDSASTNNEGRRWRKQCMCRKIPCKNFRKTREIMRYAPLLNMCLWISPASKKYDIPTGCFNIVLEYQRLTVGRSGMKTFTSLLLLTISWCNRPTMSWPITPMVKIYFLPLTSNCGFSIFSHINLLHGIRASALGHTPLLLCL